MCLSEEILCRGELINELKASPICVYGCGECGLRTYLLLREAGIGITFFSDRDRSKKGCVVDGISCITYEELIRQEKKDITLIVAIAHGERLVREFHELGFEKIYYHEAVKEKLYAEISGKDAGMPQMGIEDWRGWKQYIENLMYAKEDSVESRRNRILKLIEGKQG